MKIEETVVIKAPIDTVFEAFSDITKISERISGIDKVEILSDTKQGKGVRWRETRIIMKKEATEEMEMTEYSEPHSYVVEAESRGMHYTTRYFFDEDGSNTKVTWEFYGQPLTLGKKIFSPIMFVLFKGMTKKLMLQDMLDLQKHLEK